MHRCAVTVCLAGLLAVTLGQVDPDSAASHIMSMMGGAGDGGDGMGMGGGSPPGVGDVDMGPGGSDGRLLPHVVILMISRYKMYLFFVLFIKI